jgi:hypothetical protein
VGAISGKYTTQRDEGITYTYEASWEVFGDRATWSAKVRREGDFAGTPNGEILNTRGIDLAVAVRRLVETSIEIRAGVE